MNNKLFNLLPRFIFKIERWKYNKDYNVYVSTLGNLKGADGKFIKPKMGHHYLTICSPTGHWTGVHRLVMETWRPIKNYDEMTVDHLDHNTRNNALNNLEWVTAEENARRAEEDKITTNPVNKVVDISECGQNGIKCLSRDKKFKTLGEASLWVKANVNSVKCDSTITIDIITKKLIYNTFKNKPSYGLKWAFN